MWYAIHGLFGNKNEILIYATTRINPENMLSERDQRQKATYVIPFIGDIQNRQIYRDRKWIRTCLRWRVFRSFEE